MQLIWYSKITYNQSSKHTGGVEGVVAPCSLKFSDVSEVLAASIIRAMPLKRQQTLPYYTAQKPRKTAIFILAAVRT
jgi:hypothetical protein